MRNLANEMSIMLIMFLEGSGGEGRGWRGRDGRGRDGMGRDGTGEEWWPVERSWRMRSPGNAGSPC